MQQIRLICSKKSLELLGFEPRSLDPKIFLIIFSHVSDEEVSPIIAFWSQWTKKQKGVTAGDR